MFCNSNFREAYIVCECGNYASDPCKQSYEHPILINCDNQYVEILKISVKSKIVVVFWNSETLLTCYVM